MNEQTFRATIIAAAAVFTALFAYWCIALGAIPGVAVGLAAYLLLRGRQLLTHVERTTLLESLPS